MFEIYSDDEIYTVAHKRVEHPDIRTYHRHIHPFCELLLVIGGEVDFNIDGKIFHVKADDLIVIPKAVYHNITAVEPVPYENYVFNFYAEIMPKQYEEILFSQPRAIHISGDHTIRHFFKLLDVYYNLYDEKTFLPFAKMLVCEAATYIAANIDRYEPTIGSKSPLVDAILSLISQNLADDINSEFIAKKLSFSKSYIQNIFSSQMKIGLKEYIIQKKIFAAQNDILQGLSPIKAAQKYGFAEYSTFYRQYKKHLGTSPRG